MARGQDSRGDYGYLWAWESLAPADVAGIMRGFSAPWWICGGVALDMFVGRETRRHDDVDVAVLRRDQQALWSHLEGWDLWYATPDHSLEPWTGGPLELPIHGIWARRSTEPNSAWACEFLLNEAADDEWVFRRDSQVQLPLEAIGATHAGIPYLRPEIVLLYKAGERSPKNEADFAAVHLQLSTAARRWLAAALTTTRPNDPWIKRLGET